MRTVCFYIFVILTLAGSGFFSPTISYAEEAVSKEAPPAIKKEWTVALQKLPGALEEAIQSWKEGANSVAALKMMTAYGHYYVESRLRGAITDRIGRTRADEHEARFNEIIKGVQGEKVTPEKEASLRKTGEVLFAELRKDAQTLGGP